MTDIYLLTEPARFFGQSRKPWASLDTPALVKELQIRGFNVRESCFDAVANHRVEIRNSVVFYAFSQREHRREYIKDLMRHLDRENRLVPSLDLLLCHENKGYAELYKRRAGIIQPQAWYLSGAEDLDALTVSYPIVLKTVSGTNARGVWLCRDEAELRKHIAAISGKVSLGTRLSYYRRRHFRAKRQYPGYPDFQPAQDAEQWLAYMTPGQRFVLQEFIPDLDCDYRVIAAGSRFYLMKRLTRGGDFRASGTKRFVFDFTPPEGLLDFARDVGRRLDSPFLSMDIGHSGGGFHLFEFQALHFGTAAIVRSQRYYLYEGGSWSQVDGRGGLEQFLAQGLSDYLTGEQQDGV